MLHRAWLEVGKLARRLAWEGERLRWRLFHPITLGARIILLRDGQVLLIQHTYRPGWFLPGGGLDKGESLEECIRREAEEEAGATIRDLELLGIYSEFGEDKSDHVAIFVSRDFGWRPPAPGNEVARAEWFPLDALPCGVSAGTRRRLAELRAGCRPRGRPLVMPPGPPPGLPAEHRQAIAALARRFGWDSVGEPAPVEQSVLNANYRVDTPAGPRFVRGYRPSRTPERIAREHAVTRWAGERGIPVAPPCADASGQTVFRLGGRPWAVFPWVEGRSLLRGTMTPPEAALLGAMNGRLHRVLADWPPGDLQPNSELSWDTGKSIADLSRIDDLIRYYPAPGDEQLRVQGWVREQLALLEGGAARPSSDFDGIPLQPCHGDPHERNLMVDSAGNALAVVDWERFCMCAPAFEVLRTLTFSLLLDEPLLSAYLAGYREEHRLDALAVGACVEWWWQSQLHNTWAFRERFIKGNRTVEQFLAEGAAAIRRFASLDYRAGLAAKLLREAC